MCCVVEHAIEYHFQALTAPDSSTLELPQDALSYGWHGVASSLVMPEASVEEFCQVAVGDCALLTLHAHILQWMPQSHSLEQEFGIAVKVVQWCTQLKPKYVC